MRACMLAAAVVLGSACASGGGSAASTTHAVDGADAAKKRAIEAAKAAGYAPADYVVRAVDWVSEGPRAGSWAVSFEHVPPAPPGGHFTVFVRRDDGSTDMLKGE